MSATSTTTRRILGGGSGIAVAMGIMNVSTYGFTIVAARVLGPRGYGAFAAVMGLLIVVAVLQLGLQATGARRIAAQPEHVGEIERALLQVTYRSAWGLSLLCLALAPVFNVALHLDSLWTAVLVAVSAWPLTVMGGQAGILQGERRWYPLAVLYLAMGISRLVVGTALLLLRPEDSTAILGVAIAAFFPIIVGWVALRRSAVHRSQEASGTHGARSIFNETARNSHALLAFFALSNTDVILARSVLERHDAGLYAGGLILVKAILFLPQFVVILAFPSMSSESSGAGEGQDQGRTLRRSILVVVGLGIVGVLACWVLSAVALIFIGGPEYSEIQHQLWGFAILGTFLSAIQLLVYSVVARQSHGLVYLIWAAMALVILVGSQVTTATQMLVAVSAIDGVLFVVLTALSLRRKVRPVSAPITS